VRPNFYSIVDVLGIVYFIIFYLIANSIARKNDSNPLYKKYFVKGFYYKMIGSLGFYIIYAFYYRGGDSCTYFINGVVFNEYMLFQDFADGLRVIFSNITGVNDLPSWISNQSIYVYGEGYILRDTKALLVVRISSLISMFCLNSYLITCMAFGFLSYLAIFKLFTLFCRFYPNRIEGLSFSFLKVPSFVFWGSSVNKDTICVAMLCVLFYSFYKLFIEFKLYPKYFLAFAISAYLIFSIKSYIVIAALPGLLMFALVNYQNKVITGGLRSLFAPIMIVIAAGTFLLLYQSLSQTFTEFSEESLAEKAEGFRSDHLNIQDKAGGSGYSLGDDLDYTPSSILRKSPLALVISLFGPFPWQIRNAVMLMSSIESTYLFYMFILVLINSQGIGIFRKVSTDPIMLFCVSFTIILGVSIGLTSFNYGALVRFKIPILPFFVTFLTVMLPPDKTVRSR
jgi:hypothetical protein